METLESIIIGFFKNIPYVVSVVLFGSQARNEANKESDVDIAVLFERSHIPNTLTLIDWREELAGRVHKDVDLICLNTASPIIGMQVYSSGRNLLVNDEKKYGLYQMILFVDYVELNEIRSAMEKNILKRKFYDKS